MYPAASSLDSLAPIKPAPTAKLEAMDHVERQRIRTAAFRATRVYPGPVGELICSEVMAWEEWGYKLGSRSRIMALVEHVESTPTKTPTLAAETAA
jgi:hypothetical protein